MKKINIIFQSSPDYSNNAKALFEYININYKDKINLYWVFSDERIYNKYKNNLNCVLYNSKDFFDLFPKIDVIFTTHGQLIEQKLPHQIYVNLWHGISPKKIGYTLPAENFAEQDNEFYLNMELNVDYTIVPSRFWQLIFASRFKTNFDRILPIGYPKLDLIVNNKSKSYLQNVLDINLKEYKKIIIYAPTYKNGCNRVDVNKNNSNNIFNFDNEDNDDLIKYLHEKNYLLCIKYHPSEEIVYEKIIDDNIKYIENSSLSNLGISINEILGATDMLITDFSSLGIEYLILNKPVINITSDINEYSKNRGIMFDSSDFWLKNNVKNNDQLLEMIDKLFVNNNDNQLRTLYFSELKDGGCKNICDKFFTNDGQLKPDIKPANLYIKKKYNDLNNFNNELKNHNNELEKENYQLKNLINYKEEQLQKVYSSKGWKFLEKIRKIKRKIIK